MAEQSMTLHQRIGTVAMPTEAVGVGVGLRLHDGIEAEQVEGLHGPVTERGDP